MRLLSKSFVSAEVSSLEWACNLLDNTGHSIDVQLVIWCSSLLPTQWEHNCMDNGYTNMSIVTALTIDSSWYEFSDERIWLFKATATFWGLVVQELHNLSTDNPPHTQQWFVAKYWPIVPYGINQISTHNVNYSLTLLTTVDGAWMTRNTRGSS